MDEIEVFATGLQMGESPRWHDGRFWMCDWLADEGLVYVDQPGSMPWEDRLPGVVGLVTPDGGWREVAGDVWFPHGMALVDDGRTLVVAESHADRLTAFTLAADGSLTDRRVWAELGEGSAPDGICAEADGTIWFASVPLAQCRRVAEGGEVLHTVDVGQPAFSCVLGGDDGRTLHVVANDHSQHGVGNGRVLRVRV